MIRPFSETDLDQLLAIEKLTQFAPWSEEIFVQCLTSGCYCWVAEQVEKTIGFILLSQTMNESHVLNLCVHPDFQHQGIGEELLNQALKEVKSQGADIAYLEVRRSNYKAISLYKKAGFVEIGRRPNYYLIKDGKEDAIVYVKDLGIDGTL